MKTSLKNLLKSLFLLVVVAGSYSSCKKDNPESILEDPPVITSVEPKNPAPGDVISIKGSGFGTNPENFKITIGTTVITSLTVTPNEITFPFPVGITAGDLMLLMKGQAVINKDPNGITITPKPVVSTTPTFTAMAPSSGKTGDEIVLTGTNFSTRISDNKVFFATKTGGTVVLATIKSATATSMTVQVPANVITGGVLIDVNGTNAVPAAGFNTTFTVVEGPGGTGSNSVDYITVKSGALKFSKVASSATDIGAMHLDKAKNMIYYSDYTLLKYNNTSRVFKVDPAGTSAPTLLTSDERINQISFITSDAQGNVYVMKYESGLNNSIYKISPDGATVTEVIKNFELVAGRVHFFVDANSQVHIRPFLKVSSKGELITTGPRDVFGLQKDNGTFFNGNFAYFSQDPDNGQAAKTCRFIKYDLSKDTYTPADFTLQSLYGTDDPELFTGSKNIPWLKYALDANENFYSIMEGSYIPGSIGKTWLIRKTKNGSGTSTALGSFIIKFPAIDLNDFSSTLEFVADAGGAMYVKANSKDIIKITQ